MTEPEVSVVIPTHNRCASLLRLLKALCQQDFPADRMEVVVAADGCTDDTHAAIKAFAAPFPISDVRLSGLGPSHARNAGAAAARGRILLFIDDDIEPLPQLVSSHVSRHRASGSDRFVLMGYYPTQISTQTGFYAAALATWWEEAFEAMAVPGHRFIYSNVFAGNLSLPRKVFQDLGGFSTEFPHPGGEDYELGIRLAKKGAIFGFSRAAIGLHYETSDIRRSMRRKRIEGVSDVCIARFHPEIVPRLRLSWEAFPLSERITRWAAFKAPWVSRLIDWSGLGGARIAEAVGSRRIWIRFCFFVLSANYWRGVAEATNSLDGLREIVERGRDASEATVARVLELQLEDGIASAEAQLDEVRPSAVVVRLGDALVARWSAEPGAEDFHAAHLRSRLATHNAYAFAVAQGIKALRDEVPENTVTKSRTKAL